MNWVPALALLVTIATAENAPAISVGDGPLRTLAVVMATMLVVVFSRFGVKRIVPDWGTNCAASSSVSARIRLFERARWSLWLASVGFIIFVVQWPQVVRFDWKLNEVPVVDDLLILSPLLVSLVCSWAASYEIREEQPFHYASKPVGPGVRARAGYALERLRDEMALVLIPIAILLATADGGAFISRLTGDENGHWLAYAVGFALLIVAFPGLLRSLWRTCELPESPLKRRLASWAIELDIRLRGIHVWDCGGRIANAAVVGIVPRWRYILLTDALIDRLTSREVEAVALHEMAHIARRHTLWRTLALFPPLGAWLLVQEFWPGVTALTRQQYSLGELTFAASIPFSLAFAIYAIGVLAFISRLFEHDADLLAFGQLRLRAIDCEDEAAGADLFSALRKLVTGDRRRASRSTWLHPSVNRRLAFLRLVSMRPQRGERFRGQLRLTCTLLALCPLLTAAFLICRKLL